MDELLKNGINYRNEEKIYNFEDLCNAWLNSIIIIAKKSTFSKYCMILERHIIPELGEISVSDISQSLLEKYIINKHYHGRIDGGGPLSANTLRMISSILRSVMQYASRLGIRDFNNISLLKMRTAPREMLLFSAADQKKLEKYLLNKEELPAYGIYIALYTGLRLGELCALTWKDIDLEEGYLSVKKTLQRIQLTSLSARYETEESNIESDAKTKIIVDVPKSYASMRKIPLTACLIAILKPLKAQFSKESFFLTGKEKQFMDPRNYQKKFKCFLKECELEARNFHILRHQFASNCIACGVDPKTLSEFLGHSSVNTTLNRYVHSSSELKRTQMNKLELMHI